MKRQAGRGVVLLAGLLWISGWASSVRASTFTVTSTNDSGAGSLRTAIINALSNGVTADTITFSIAGAGVHTIALSTPLPYVSAPNKQILADTQSGYALGAPTIHLVPGALAAQSNSVLTLTSSNCVVRGFHISNFSNTTAVILNGSGGHTVAANVLVNNLDGIAINGGSNDLVGGYSASERNVVSSNGDFGIVINSPAANGTIAGNFLGTTLDGLAAWPNRLTGLAVSGGRGFTIKGTNGAPQVISGNGWVGLSFSGTGSVGCVVYGNYIGTDVTGMHGLRNANYGLYMDNAAGVSVGGSSATMRNVIAGQTGYNVAIQNGSYNNAVVANYIGVGSNGVTVVTNLMTGVLINNSSSNAIGLAGMGNVVATIEIVGSNAVGNMVYGNLIGVNAVTSAIPNTYYGYGVFINDAPQGRIGGSGAGQGNLIANRSIAIQMQGTNAMGNWIQGNLIGMDAAGNAQSNSSGGIILNGTASNIVGGVVASGRNIIGNCGGNALAISGRADGNYILENYIGLDPTGTRVESNSWSGIDITDSAVQIGALGFGGVVSGCNGWGIAFHGACSGSVVQAYYVGTSAAGTNAIPNSYGGIDIGSPGVTVGFTNSWFGTNVICGNGSGGGILVEDGAHNAVICGNFVGVSATGSNALPNLGTPIRVGVATNVTIGGMSRSAGNVVGASLSDAINIAPGADGALISGNLIGTSASGLAALTNSGTGINITRSQGVRIGVGCGNVVGGNGAYGIYLGDGSHNAVIQGNIVGLTASGSNALPNANIGIYIGVATNVTIGGGSVVLGNVVGNSLVYDGIYLAAGADGASIDGNHVGTSADGMLAMPNNGPGICIAASRGVRVGAACGNLIAGNNGYGLYVGDGSHNAVIQGNIVGISGSGSNALPNAGNGICVGIATNVTIGGGSVALGNVVGNSLSADGISLAAGADGATIDGNRVGTSVDGMLAMPNGGVGINVTSSRGVRIGTACGNVIAGNNGYGLYVGNGSHNAVICANYIGVSSNGAYAIPNGSYGIYVGTATNVMIGGTNAAQGNVVSGNGGNGLYLADGTHGAVIRANYIGVSASGSIALPNSGEGIYIGVATNVTVGGTNTTQGNVVSGNTAIGVHLAAGADGAVIDGNRIGTDALGLQVVSNGASGLVLDRSLGVRIGVGYRNIIGGNHGTGITLGSGSHNAVISANYIGVSAGGATALPNTSDGLSIGVATNVTVGGVLMAQRNVISASGGNGVIMASGSDGALVEGNYIGTDVNAATALRNGGTGVNLSGSRNAGVFWNIISGNGGDGVHLGNGSHSACVCSNLIGVSGVGSVALTNQGAGISIDHARGVQISGNTLAGNQNNGISISGGSTNAVINGNRIGVGSDGATAVGNGGTGISITSSPGALIGGEGSGQGNVVSGCTGAGITLSGGSDDAVLIGNRVGVSQSGMTAVTNNGTGISVSQSQRIQIGGTNHNVVGANFGYAISLGSDVTNVVVAGNMIGVNSNATAVMPNGNYGVLGYASQLTVGSVDPALRNIVGGFVYGVTVQGGSAVRVVGNYIGIGADGSNALANYHGLILQGSSTGVVVGGTAPGERNVISRNQNEQINLNTSLGGHRIQGNYIGVTANGLPYGTSSGADAIKVFNTPGNLIGGTTNAGGNVIGGTLRGIWLLGTGSCNNVVSGNRLGVDATGSGAARLSDHGVLIQDGSNNRIGGTAAERNIIANNADGVTITNIAVGNLVVANLIYSNTPNANLALRGVNPNNNQAAPSFVSAFVVSNLVYVKGTLGSAPSRNYWIDLYQSSGGANIDATSYLGRVPLTTGASGTGTFVAGFATAMATGSFVSATATDQGSNTSPFALSPALNSQTELDTDGDGIPDYWELLHGLDPNTPNPPNQDSDGDGVPDVLEYLADTDPQDPKDYLRITSITNTLSSCVITFESKGSRTYTVEGATNLLGVASWNVVNAAQPGTGSSVSESCSAAAASQLLRIRVGLPQ